MAHTTRSSYQLSAVPFVIFAQLLAIGVTTLVLVLFLRFGGGFAFKSDDKMKIFNVGFSARMHLMYSMVPRTLSKG